jgi:hypothetical protein
MYKQPFACLSALSPLLAVVF